MRRPYVRLVCLLVMLVILAGLFPVRQVKAFAPEKPGRRELVDQRKANVKVYETEAGPEYEVFARAVHFYDENGTWQDIKPEVRASAHAAKYARESYGVPFQASFTDREGANEVEFRHNGAAIRFQIGDDQEKSARIAEPAGRHVAYRSIKGGKAYDYEVTPIGLKETLELYRAPEENKFVFPFAAENVKLSERPDGSIEAVGPEGAVFWKIASPTAVDAAGNWAPSVTQTVLDDAAGQRLVVTVDDAWLNDPARQWPILIDPTLLIVGDGASAADATVGKLEKNRLSSSTSCTTDLDGSRTYLRDSQGQLTAGLSWEDWTYDKCTSQVGLLKFDLRTLPPGKVLSARLMLWSTASAGTGRIAVRPVGQEWEEGTVAYAYPWAELKAPLVGAETAAIDIPKGIQGLQQVEIRELVSQWLASERPNYGLALTGPDTGKSTYMTFSSSESADPTVVPKLLVTMQADITAPTFTAAVETKPYGSGFGTGTGVKVTVDSESDQIDRIELYVDGRLSGQARGPMQSFTFMDLAGLSKGTHKAEVRVFDRAGNQGSKMFDVVTSGTPAPAEPTGMALGGDRIRLSWTAVPGEGMTYNVYRGTNRDFVPTTPVASGLTETTYVDTALNTGSTYYYRITAKDPDPASVQQSAPSPTVALNNASDPGFYMSYRGSGTDVSVPRPVLRQLSFYPAADPSPTLVGGTTVTAAHTGLALVDAQMHSSSTPTNEQGPLPSAAGLVQAHLISFDLLAALNAHYERLGLGRLEAADLASTVASVGVLWYGYGVGDNGADPASGVQIRLWNRKTHEYGTAKSSLSSGVSAAISISPTNPADYVDENGQVHALVQTLYPASGTAASTLTSDYAHLIVTFGSHAPAWISGAPTGNGQVSLTWETSGLAYYVERAKEASFAAPWKSPRLVTAKYVDSPESGDEPGTPFYYRVKTEMPDGTEVTSATVAAVPDPSPAAITQPGTARSECFVPASPSGSYLDLDVLNQLDGQAESHTCSSQGNIPIHMFRFDLLTALEQYEGLTNLTVTNIADRLGTVTMEWAGSASSGATVLVSSGGSWSTVQVIGATDNAQRALVQVPSPQNYLDENGQIWIGIRTTSASPASGSPYTLSTDLVRVIATLKTSTDLAVTLTENQQVTVEWNGSTWFNVYRKRPEETHFARLNTEPIRSYFIDTTPEIGATHTYRVKPVDPATGEGAVYNEQTITIPNRLEETAATFTGSSWFLSSIASASGGEIKSVSYTNADTGHAFSTTFTGTGVSYIAAKGQTYGKVTVSIDGISKGIFSLYYNGTRYQQVIYTTDDLPFGQHTITISYYGPDSGNFDGMNVDAFDVRGTVPKPTSVPATVQDNLTILPLYVTGASRYRVYKLENDVFVPVISQETNLYSSSHAVAETAANYTGTQSGQVLSIDSSALVDGYGSLKVVADGTMAGQGFKPNSGISLQGLHTFSVHLKALSNSAQVRLRMWNATTGTFMEPSTTVTLSELWQRYSVTVDVGVAPQTIVPIVETVAATQVIFWADNLQMEAGPNPTMWMGSTNWHTVAGSNRDTYAMTVVNAAGRESSLSSNIEPAAGPGRYDDTHSLLSYQGAWETVANPSAVGGTLHRSSVAESTVSFTMSGRGFRVLAPKGPGYGTLEVCRSTSPTCTTVDLYSATILAAQPVYYYLDGLSITAQTVTIKVKNPGVMAAIDAVEVLPGKKPWVLEAKATAGRVDLTWAGTTLATSGYKVYRKSDQSGPWELLTPTPITGTSYSVSGPSGAVSQYAVAGVQGDGTLTAPSNEAVPQNLDSPARGIDGRYPYVMMPWASTAAYVDLRSGNFVLPVTDAVVPAGRLAVVLRRTYNSNDTKDRGLGIGWRLNAQQEIEVRGNKVVWTDGDGSETVFSPTPDGKYQSELQTFDILTKTSETSWEILRKDGITHSFTADQGAAIAYQTAMSDRYGNRITYKVDPVGRVLGITPSMGRPWTLTYNASSTVLTTEKTDPTESREYTFTFDATRRMITSTDANGASTGYGYDGSGRVNVVTDPSMRKTSVSYTVDGGVETYRDGLGNENRFSVMPGQATVTNPLGQSTKFVLNQLGRLIQTVDPLNGVTSLTHDGQGNVIEVKDALGRTTRLSKYDQWGNPGVIIDAMGNSTTLEYHPVFHLPTVITDALKGRQVFEYDAKGSATKVTLAAGTTDEQVVQYSYYPNGLRERLIDPRPDGFVTTYTYDASGWLTSIVDPQDNATTFAYDWVGNLTSQKDPMGRETRYAYDNAGRRTRVTYPDHVEESVVYDASGLPVLMTDPTGAEVRYEYDAAGRVTSKLDALRRETQYQYDAAGRPIVVVDPRGNRWITEYDALGRPTASRDPEGNTTSTVYDAVGNATQIRLPNGYTVTAEYDPVNRQIRTTAPPATTEVTYDALGNRVLVKDGNGHLTRYEYDGLNRLVKVYDARNVDSAGKPKSGAVYIGYEYDKAGNKICITDALGHATAYTYDPMNRVVSETDPMGNQRQFMYDAAGQQVLVIKPDGAMINYAYNERGWTVEMWVDNRRYDRAEFEYDAAGRKTAVYDHGVTTYRYDRAGQLLEHVDPRGNATQYGYDANGNLTRLTIREGTWTYAYDGANRMAMVRDPAGLQTSYTYTPDGQRLRVDLPHGVVMQNQYDPATNRLVQMRYEFGSLERIFNYKYDTKGNVIDDGTPYKYDEVDRLIQSGRDGSSRSIYEYDAVGNRTKRTVYDNTDEVIQTDAFTYDAANRILKLDQVKSGADYYTQYVYDSTGRLIISTVWKSTSTPTAYQYEYDDYDRLIRHASKDAITTFEYDGEGRRLSRKVLDRSTPTYSKGVYFQYFGSQVIAERDPAGTLEVSVTRGANGELLTLNQPKESYVFITDRLGSVVELISDGSSSVNSYSYDAFGNVTSATEGVQNDWKFTGQMFDGSTGLYHLSARYYMPSDGRFITQDTYKGSPWEPWTQNLYTYVGNNPVNFVDPTGHMAVDYAGGGGGSFPDVTRAVDDWSEEHPYGSFGAAVVCEVCDWTMTLSDIGENGLSWRHLWALVPFVPGTVGKLVRNVPGRFIRIGDDLVEAERHHVIPQALKDKLSGILNVDDFTIDIDKKLHKGIHGDGPRGGDYNRDWEDWLGWFEDEKGRLPTTNEVLEYAETMKGKYGIEGEYVNYHSK